MNLTCFIQGRPPSPPVKKDPAGCRLPPVCVVNTDLHIMKVFGLRQRDLIVMCYCSIDETTTFHSSYKRSSNFMSTCTFTIYDDQLAQHSVTVQSRNEKVLFIA